MALAIMRERKRRILSIRKLGSLAILVAIHRALLEMFQNAPQHVDRKQQKGYGNSSQCHCDPRFSRGAASQLDGVPTISPYFVRDRL
jgi:hypothetical protein